MHRFFLPCRNHEVVWRRLFATLVVIAVFAVFSGCATEDIIVSEVALTDRPDASVVGWTADEPGQYVFSPEDEEVTIKLLFDFNYRGVYEWYKVEWVAPGGSDYQVVSRRTDFGSHRDLKASMKIRGKMAARLPGLWRVRVSLLGREGAPDRELVSRLFRIDEPTPEMIAAGLTPIDPPDANRNRPLASYTRLQTKTADKKIAKDSAASTSNAVDDATQAESAVEDFKTAETASLKPNLRPPEPAASGPGILPSLAIVAPSGAASSIASKRKRLTPSPAPTLPTKANVSAVTLRSTPSKPGNRVTRRPLRARTYDGCPPLYYRPGPGCVEQAPQE